MITIQMLIEEEEQISRRIEYYKQLLDATRQLIEAYPDIHRDIDDANEGPSVEPIPQRTF